MTRASGISIWWRRTWEAPDVALLGAGVAGELLVARVRFVICAAVVMVPLINTVRDPQASENVTGLLFASSTLVLGLWVYHVALRGVRVPWLGFATSIFDVTIITLTQAAFLWQDLPGVAANNRTTYAVYFVALLGTCLRYDVRICWVAGALATLQYVAIAATAGALWPEGGAFAFHDYGTFMAGDQIGRVILLVAATAMCATIVRRASHLRISSTHDSLTGLYNRTFFDERFGEEVLRAARYRRPLAIAMLDIDHFKHVNDQFGHASGDEVIRAFAGVLRDSVRRTDLVGRYGGEEFAIAFIETEPDEALAKLEQVREAVASLDIWLAQHGCTVRVTCTAGLTAFPDEGDVPHVLVDAADRRLLSGKRAGRNRVIAA